MRFFKWYAVLLIVVLAQTIAGCGGGGGSTVTPPTTKTATLEFSSQITNPVDLISGFELTVNLPVGSSISADTVGTPLLNTVVSAVPGMSDAFYLSTSRTLKVTYMFSNDYSLQNFFKLGKFITILVTVPFSYEPNTNNITYVFKPLDPLGADMPSVTATATFN